MRIAGGTVSLDVTVQRIPEACGVALFGHLRIDQHEAVVRDERVRRHDLVPPLAVLAAVRGLPVRMRRGPVPEVRAISSTSMP